jgi:hypothetical protein
MAKTRRLNKYVLGKQLTQTTNVGNQNAFALSILQAEFPIIIGSTVQVQNGIATSSDPQAALSSAPPGAMVLWLAGTYTENVTLTGVSGVRVIGQGYGVNLVGNLSFVGTTLMDVSGINITGNVDLDVASTRNFLYGWQSGGTVNNVPGAANEVVLL